MAAKNYGALVKGRAKFAGVDQGIDFTGSGQVLALGAGVVTRIASGTGWPGGHLIVYRLTDGPAQGRYVYVAESIVASKGLRVGSVVQQGQVIGSFKSTWPGIEVGWADANGHALAPLNSKYHSQPTVEGHDFLSFVLGSKRLPSPSAVPGSPPPGLSSAPVQASGETAASLGYSGPPTYQADYGPLPAREPGEGLGGQPVQAASVAQNWQQIASQPGSSPESQMYAQNARLAEGQ